MSHYRETETLVTALLEKASQNVRQAGWICDHIIRDHEEVWDVNKERDMQHLRARLHNLSRQADEARRIVLRCTILERSMEEAVPAQGKEVTGAS